MQGCCERFQKIAALNPGCGAPRDAADRIIGYDIQRLVRLSGRRVDDRRVVLDHRFPYDVDANLVQQCPGNVDVDRFVGARICIAIDKTDRVRGAVLGCRAGVSRVCVERGATRHRPVWARLHYTHIDWLDRNEFGDWDRRSNRGARREVRRRRQEESPRHRAPVPPQIPHHSSPVCWAPQNCSAFFRPSVNQFTLGPLRRRYFLRQKPARSVPKSLTTVTEINKNSAFFSLTKQIVTI